jgi:hypothetical protein
LVTQPVSMAYNREVVAKIHDLLPKETGTSGV